jgi:hypothetical protein
VAYRDCCGHWQVILKLFVMVIPKNDFSLFVVFSCVGWLIRWGNTVGVRRK